MVGVGDCVMLRGEVARTWADVESKLAVDVGGDAGSLGTTTGGEEDSRANSPV